MKQDQFASLDLPVPPDFEGALGYPGNACYVAFYWAPAGNELMYADGQTSATGEYAPWLLWIRHISVVPKLIGFAFGNSDMPARHWLLLDRRERQFYVGGAGQIASFFSGLHDADDASRAWDALSQGTREHIQTEAWRQLQEAMEHLSRVAMKVRLIEDKNIPRRRSDVFLTSIDTSSGCLWTQVTEFLQLPDPAWCIAFHHERFVIDR